MAYLGDKIKKLGFGLMRLPKDGDKIDITQVKDMVDRFLEAGFTYFDTAWAYPGSEDAIRQALIERYPRDKFQLATKLAAWLGAKNPQEAKEMFFTSLKRTGAGYFDFYLLHNLGGNRTEVFDNFGLWDFVLEQREKGLIKHIGFSFHDKADVLEEILSKHPEMEFVQLQINYADWDDPWVQSRKCYEIAKKYRKPIVIMEPLKGGLLANPPDAVKEVLRAADSGASFASWGIRFAASLENVITVLSGMSNIEQMNDNIATMTSFKPLNEAENVVIDKSRAVLNAIPRIPCTDCRYCMKGCPMKIAIPAIFDIMNRYQIYKDLNNAKSGYRWATNEGGIASKCIECGQCESVCPQNIGIINELKRAARTLE